MGERTGKVFPPADGFAAALRLCYFVVQFLVSCLLVLAAACALGSYPNRMTTKEFISLALIAAGMAGAGYWMGRHQDPAAGQGTGVALAQPGGTEADGTRAVPPARRKRAEAPTGTIEKSSRSDARLSLAEIEEKLQSLKEGDRRGSREWQRFMGLLDALAPDEVPQALAFAEKNPSKSVRDGL